WVVRPIIAAAVACGGGYSAARLMPESGELLRFLVGAAVCIGVYAAAMIRFGGFAAFRRRK
ncbi:MAG: hypothetical protein IIU66_05910, partial [Clostridia bacterium]|nr:hypothetical protein [Clostridia bacterium]